MSRRTVLILLGLATLFAFAVAPWTMSSARLNDQVRRQLKNGYGLDLVASGRTTFALLPVPRLKFADATLANPDGRPLIRGAQLRGGLRLLPLFAARLEITDVSIADARIAVEIGRDGSTSWDAPLAKLKARATQNPAGPAHVRRLLVARSDIDIDDRRTGSRIHVGPADFVVRWPNPDSGIDMSGSARWGGETVDLRLTELQPAALAAGRTSPLSLRASSRMGALTLSGDVDALNGFRLDGRIAVSIPALDAFLRWTGLARPRPGTGHPLEAIGEVAIGPGEIGFPQIRLTFDGEPLDGAVMVRHDGARPSVRATLAGGLLDLSALLPAASPRGRWSVEAADLDALRSADIDLRLSASGLQLGGMQFGDVAASLLTSPDRIELSLSRSTLNGGVAKGRAALASGPGAYDLKVQASVAQLDIGAWLTSLGQPRSVSGTALGQAALEATGNSSDDILRSLSGRAAIIVKTGEVSGLSLTEALRQAYERSSGTAQWRGGRTPFQQAQLSLSLAGGIADIQDGTLDSAALHTSLQGQVSLRDGTVSLRARTAPPLDSVRNGPAFVLDVDGPWDRPRILPSVEALIQPSGAGPSAEAR